MILVTRSAFFKGDYYHAGRSLFSMLEWSCSMQMAGFLQLLAYLINRRQLSTPDHLICKRADDAVISELPEMHNAGAALHSSASYWK